MPSCTRCGRQLRGGAKFCSVCGAPVTEALVVAVSGTAASSSEDAAFLLFPDGRKSMLHPSGAIIGRGSECDIVIPNDSVSIRHAEIVLVDASYALRDLGSRNGTWVNRQRLTGATPLNSGDEITFGEVLCVFGLKAGALLLVGAPPETRTIAPPHAGLPATLPGASPLLSPVQTHAGVSLREWDPLPQAEGRVLDVQGPIMEKKSDVGTKVALAVGLALIAAPLAWLPFAADRNEIAVRYLRIEDLHTGRIVSVKMIGDPSGTVAVGDTLAIWGVEDGGNLFMRAAFNYTTNAEVRLRA